MFGLPIKALIIAGAVLAVIASYGATYWAGHSAGTKGEALRTERAVSAERERVMKVNAAQLEAARRQYEASEAENAATQGAVDVLEAELFAREAELARLEAEDALSPTPPMGCRCSTNPKLSPSDAGKLNAVR